MLSRDRAVRGSSGAKASEQHRSWDPLRIKGREGEGEEGREGAVEEAGDRGHTNRPTSRFSGVESIVSALFALHTPLPSRELGCGCPNTLCPGLWPLV